MRGYISAGNHHSLVYPQTKTSGIPGPTIMTSTGRGGQPGKYSEVGVGRSTGEIPSVTGENPFLPPLPVGRRIELSFARRVSLLRNLLKIEEPVRALRGVRVHWCLTLD